MLNLIRAGASRCPLPLRRFNSTRVSVTEVLSSGPNLKIDTTEYSSYEDDLKPRTKGSTYKKDLHLNVLPGAAKGTDRANVPDGTVRRAKTALLRLKRAKDKREETDEVSNQKSKVRLKRQGELSEKEAAFKNDSSHHELRPSENEFIQAKKLAAHQVPKIAHDLDRVLFTPGVQFLQDPRTRTFNFSPYLKKIVHHEDFDFSKVAQYVSASKDEILLKEATKHNRQFYSSTSSMTLTLRQLYLLLNNYSDGAESKHRFNFPEFSRTATSLPLCVIVEPRGVPAEGERQVYSVTADKSADVEELLSAMGHCLETLLTTSEDEFKAYLKSSESSVQGVEPAPNTYNYLAYGDFLMRSQLDCYDPRLPGNGTFDLKTRAVCAIRYDRSSDASKCDYQVWKTSGEFESFEREYDDLIRTGALLKYMFQARIGQMDGIFVAYHNVNSFFGFQYLPLSEIDKIFYTDEDAQKRRELSGTAVQIAENDNIATFFAENQFKASLDIWQTVMQTVISDLEQTEYRGHAFRLACERFTNANDYSGLRVFAVPLTAKNVDDIQSFPSKFQTSFRENITPEERLNNLEENQQKLNEFNAALVADTPVLSYKVHAWPTFGDANARHPYPKSTSAVCGWTYRIRRDDQDPKNPKKDKTDAKNAEEKDDDNKVVPSRQERVKQLYLLLMQYASSLLTLSRPSKTGKNTKTMRLRKFSELGRIRKEQWQAKEEPPRHVHRSQ